MAKTATPKKLEKPLTQASEKQGSQIELKEIEEEYPFYELAVSIPLPEKRPAVAKPRRASLIKAPIPWSRSDPAMVLGKSGSFFNLSDSLHPMDLVHVAGFGGTGSGKTVSLALPFVKAAIGYQLNNKKKAAVFVLDPKKELLQHIRSTLDARGEAERLVIIGECPPIQLFTRSCELSATDRFRLLREFFPAIEESGNGGYWKQQSDAMVTDLIELEMLYFEQKGARFLRALGYALVLPNVSNLGYWALVKAVLAYSCKSHLALKKTNATIQELFSSLPVTSPALEIMAPFLGTTDLIEQWSYTVMSAQSMLGAFSDRSIESFVDLDVIGEAFKRRTQVESLIDESKVVVFSPERTAAHAAAGKAVKQRFYESVYSREDMEKPIFFVLDEFQTFVSPSDTDLIDCCRAYRCMLIVCSQSISSLKHALGNTNAAQNITQVLMTNLPTTFSFRTNDALTSAWLRTQLPIAPDGGPHLLDVRRLSSLEPGEAFYTFADGITWGRDRASMDC